MALPSNEILDSFLTNQRQELKYAMMLLASELASAERKHPRWPTDVIHRAAIVVEEAGELQQAALQLTYEGGVGENVNKEAIQTGATCLRFIMSRDTMTIHNTQ